MHSCRFSKISLQRSFSGESPHVNGILRSTPSKRLAAPCKLGGGQADDCDMVRRGKDVERKTGRRPRQRREAFLSKDADDHQISGRTVRIRASFCSSFDGATAAAAAGRRPLRLGGRRPRRRARRHVGQRAPRVPGAARAPERRAPTSAAQHALLVIGTALVLRPTVERNPVPHTVDRRLLHPIGIIIGCPWMSAVRQRRTLCSPSARAA